MKCWHKARGVWQGSWSAALSDGVALKQGACAKHYAIFSNSRIQAEGPWQGSVFKCHKIPLEQAIKTGTYGTIDLTEHLNDLQAIFAGGVCDYSQGDAGRPKDI